VPPERADLVLPSYIPNGERDVLVFYGLDIETLITTMMSSCEWLNIGHSRTDCGDGGDDFAELEFIEYGGFASGIKADLY
jgi:hypothetical protein